MRLWVRFNVIILRKTGGFTLRKYVYSTIFLLLLIISLVAYYYFVPLSSNKVIPSADSINKINFGHLIEDGNVSIYSIILDEPAEISELLDLFGARRFTRSIGSEHIRNQTDSIRMTIFYSNEKGDNNNYDIDINDQGYVVVNHKKFKIKDTDTLLYNQIRTYLLEKM
jgi:hypothetical protein